MPLDLVLSASFLAKMGFAAAAVLAVTLAAERAGPMMGAFLATLPVSAGPAYILLALDHDAAFLSQSAIFTLAMNPAVAIFSLLFVLFAGQQRLLLSIAAPLAVWLALAFLVRSSHWTVAGAMLTNAVVLPVCHLIARPYRKVTMPRMPLSAVELLFRVTLTVLVLAVVVIAGFYIGPSGSGVLAIFPAVYVTVMLSLQRRVGGPAAAALVAHGFLGMTGFSFAVLTLHFAAMGQDRRIACCLRSLIDLEYGCLLEAKGSLRGAGSDHYGVTPLSPTNAV